MNNKLAFIVAWGGVLLLTGCAGFGEPVVEDEVENLDVPFTSQAPDKLWYEPWLNACEETSILMVDLYYSEQDSLTIEEAKARILEILSTKENAFDYSKDESMETVQSLIEALELNWGADVVDDPTLEVLLKELDGNRPVIVPVYAPQLDNPYYEGEGPDYYVLVLVGYDLNSEEFIFNDPGTQHGNALRVEFDVLLDSIHDLNPNDYDAGRKRVLFTYPVEFVWI